MSNENSKASFKTRLVNIISAFDATPGDYLFEGGQDSHNKIQELEARIARLENTAPAITDVRHKEAV